MPLTLLEPRPHATNLWAHPFIVTAVERRHAGLVLKAWREAQWPDQVPQDRLARMLGVHQATLSLWETRRHPPHGPREWDNWMDVIGAPTWVRWWLAEEEW